VEAVSGYSEPIRVQAVKPKRSTAAQKLASLPPDRIGAWLKAHPHDAYRIARAEAKRARRVQ